MPESSYQFPDGFLWGTATAAHQVEGGNSNNNWAAWENEAGRIHNGEKSGLACDWRGGRWREDLGNAARDGQNAHRFSIEWSRVQPSPDRWDDSALDFYRELVMGMKALGMQPVADVGDLGEAGPGKQGADGFAMLGQDIGRQPAGQKQRRVVEDALRSRPTDDLRHLGLQHRKVQPPPGRV